MQASTGTSKARAALLFPGPRTAKLRSSSPRLPSRQLRQLRASANRRNVLKVVEPKALIPAALLLGSLAVQSHHNRMCICCLAFSTEDRRRPVTHAGSTRRCKLQGSSGKTPQLKTVSPLLNGSRYLAQRHSEPCFQVLLRQSLLGL